MTALSISTPDADILVEMRVLLEQPRINLVAFVRNAFESHSGPSATCTPTPSTSSSNAGASSARSRRVASAW
jgi:hypothetical protein